MKLVRNWVEVALSDLGEWRGGGTPSKQNPGYWTDGTIPWVSPKDMKSDLINGAQDRITQAALDDGAVSIIPAGSVLIVTRSGILVHSVPVGVTQVDVTINQDIKALVPYPGVDPTFVAEQIRAMAPDLLAYAGKAGTTVESLAFDRLKSFTIRLAPPQEQVAIGREIQHLRARIARARSAADLVPDSIASIAERIAGMLAAGMLSSSGMEPRGDPATATVQELLVQPARTGLSIRGSIDPPGVRALRLSALRTPIVDLADVRYLPIEEEATTNYKIEAGDVLISRGSGTRRFVARAALVPIVNEHTLFPDTAYRLRFDLDRVVPEWFVAVWNAPATRADFENRIRTTAGIWKVAWRDLRDVRIELPSVEEQSDAVEALRAATARLKRAAAKRDAALRTLNRYEVAMTSRAFDGELVKPLAGDEVPATLMARLIPSPVAATKKNRRHKVVKRTPKFEELLESWPTTGQTFEQLRTLLPAKYENAKTVVFEALESGVLKQRYDAGRDVMIFVKPS